MIDNKGFIIEKINDFIQKYYQIKILKGSILSALFFFTSSLLLFVSEYFGQFNIPVRSLLFYVGIVANIAFIIIFLIKPIIERYYKYWRMDYKKAAKIISTYFTEIEDKLNNIIELNEIQNSNYSKELIIASIEKKSSEVSQFNFINAISKKDLYNILKGLTAIVLVVFMLLFYKPVVITQGAERIINHNKYYIPKNFYEIELVNSSLEIERGKSITILAKSNGNAVPEEVLISYGGNDFYMHKKETGLFEYQLKSINNDILFYFKSTKYNSQAYKIKVKDIPILLEYTNYLEYPTYTGITSENYENTGDIKIPIGTIVKWRFNSVYTDSIKVLVNKNENDSNYKFKSNEFSFSFLKNSTIAISLKNNEIEKRNILKQKIEVIPDLYPGINMNFAIDSNNMNLYHIYGKIEDDYGFTKLQLLSERTDSITINIPINKSLKEQEFYYLLDIRSVGSENENIYLKIWDNDEINGYKSTKSEVIAIINPTIKEKNDYKDAKYNELTEKVKESLDLTNKIKKEIDDLRKDIVNEKLSEWEIEEKLKSITEKQKKLENLQKEINNINKEKDNFNNSFSENNDAIKEKQKEINDLLEKLMNDELKELFKELEELLKENKMDNLNELMENMDFSYEELEKELDRNLEMLKRFEIEEKINNQIDELKQLSEEEKELSEKHNQDGIKNKQEELKNNFQEIEKAYKDALEKNENLKNPLKLEKFEDEFNEINQDLEKIEEGLENENSKETQKQQKETSEKMKELSEKLNQMMQNNFSEMLIEDYDNLRQILDNLLTFSYDQEENMNFLNETNINDPKFSRIIKNQNDLKSNFKIIEDSLNTLGERVVAINKIITDELYEINNEFKKLNTSIENRNKSSMLMSQQFIMTSANNLALLLVEILENMQDSMGSGKGGKNSKNKKKQAAEQMQDLRQNNESLKNQLQNMINQMKNAKDSKSPGQSKSISDMLAKQEIYQKMLQDIMNGSSIGNDVKQKLEEINKLIEDNKRDLINQKIDRNLLKRQELIVTRLLEAENSEFEREKEEKRKSKENKLQYQGNNNKIFEYKEENYNFNEILNINNLKLNDYYQKKYKDYLLKISNE